MLALFAGRNGANALNRYVDAEIDQKNPRTASRHIPAGKVRRQEALYITIACYILFVVAAAQINPLCLYLSPIALILFTLYSYTKTFYLVMSYNPWNHLCRRPCWCMDRD